MEKGLPLHSQSGKRRLARGKLGSLVGGAVARRGGDAGCFLTDFHGQKKM